MNRTYGIDVASYQDTDLAAYHNAGASFAIVDGNVALVDLNKEDD